MASRLRPLLLLLLACVLAVPAAAQPRELVLQLGWRHQWQFAGYYAAIERGYFREAGFDVVLRETRGDVNPIEPVLDGQAHFGVAGADLLLHYARGAPVVAIAAFYQHSPLVLIARPDLGIDNLHQLVDRPIALESQSADLLAMLQREQVPLERIRWLPHPRSVQPLIDREVHAISAHVTDEPFELQRAGVPFRMFSPRMAGIDFYSEVLFTSRAFADEDPATVTAFLEAARRGWQYAIEHPEEVAELIHTRYSSRHSLAQLNYEAVRSLPLIMADVVELGYMHPGRWRHIAEVSVDVGMLTSVPDLDAFLFRPDPPEVALPVRFYVMSALAGAAALFFGALSLGFYRLNRRLTAEITARAELEVRLREMAFTDALTGALNRRSFIDQFRRLRAMAQRDEQVLSLISCDLDLFKQFNDTWGHEKGDMALVHFVGVVRSVLREGDLLARAGGEEFLILLPNTSLEAARGVADRLHQALNQTALDIHGMMVPLTASIGVAEVVPDEDEDASLRRADAALYEAKRQGRNNVRVAASR